MFKIKKVSPTTVFLFLSKKYNVRMLSKTSLLLGLLGPWLALSHLHANGLRGLISLDALFIQEFIMTNGGAKCLNET